MIMIKGGTRCWRGKLPERPRPRLESGLLPPDRVAEAEARGAAGLRPISALIFLLAANSWKSGDWAREAPGGRLALAAGAFNIW